jgi:hypothetical protein
MQVQTAAVVVAAAVAAVRAWRGHGCGADLQLLRASWQ